MANGVIDNCHFHNNAVGVRLKPDITIINSVIEFNTVGVEADHPLVTSGANFHDNNICNNLTYNFKHFYGYPMNISDNCWCSDNVNEISQTIFDAYDNASLGIVTFSPINTDCASSLSIENSPSMANNFQFYPNPTTGLITFNSDSNKHIVVYSVDGEIVFDRFIQEYVDLSNLSAGMYFVKFIENNSFFSVQKLLKY
jgi:Secretion system C-terminal sorting domain